MFRDTLKRTLGYGRYIRMRELLGAPKIYNEAFDKHQAIFIHIPKAAGTSIGEAIFGAGNSTHYWWDCYQSYDPDKFARYFKFSFVRNPFDRLVSAFVYLQNGGKSISEHDKKFQQRYLSQYSTFKQFVANGLTREPIRTWGHFMPQKRFIASDSAEIMVDFIGRVESLEADFQIICKRLNVTAQLVHTNRSNRVDLREYYDSQTERIVGDVYGDDFRLLGYSNKVI